MMRFLFERGYICCGCNLRYRKRDAEFVYKRSCLCKDCYSKFIPYSSDAYHEERDTMAFMAAIFHYKTLYRRMFLDFKFQNGLASGHLLGMAMERLVSERDAFDGYDHIVPVPISRIRYNERGYNQSEILSRYVSRALDIPVLNALERVRHSLPQSNMSHHLRKENVDSAFSVTAPLDGKNIILFDDIYTTGSTASECVNALHRAGADKVCVLVGAYNQPVVREYFTELF